MSKAPIILVCALALAAQAAATDRYGDHVLSYGARDSDFAAEYVTMLQTDLYQLGYGSYLEGKDEADGVFGHSTEAAVKAFQREYGVAVTGKVDAETTAALERALAGGAPAPQGPPPTLTLLDSQDLVIKEDVGKGRVKITPEKGVTYVFTGQGECLGCRVITPFGAYSDTKDAPADVVAALKALGDTGKAVIYDSAAHAGAYELEVEALNDLKDTPVHVNIYQLTRE